ncbi:hypothetical protein SAMN06297422_10567 [Lachnospiraceae bacterium]|nr:hypothetical protein SAMN06297422_10567 [Lachnospiraceae bacterium]
MPKYRPSEDDYMIFSAAVSLYGAFAPIEEKLKAGGYKGPFFADFKNDIYKNLEIIDDKATQKKQEDYDKKNPDKPKKVSPVYKSTELDHINQMDNLELSESVNLYRENSMNMKKTLSKNQEKKFWEYSKKYENYLDLIIKNTPEDEYPNELNEIKFNKAYLRMIRVYGSRELLEDQMGFLLNARGFDGDHAYIKYSKKDSGISRELWRLVDKNYPYSEHREAITNLINAACDYEENKEKDTYIEQIKARENYKKCLKNYLKVNSKLMETREEGRRMIKLDELNYAIKSLKLKDGEDKKIDYEAIYKRVNDNKEQGKKVDPKDKEIYDKIMFKANNLESIIRDLKQKDGPDKDIDYYAIYQRAKDKIDNNEEVDLGEKEVYDKISNEIERWLDSKDDYDSRYGLEIEAMGYYLNGDKDFTRKRGNRNFETELEAQINAIDMGWPMDELIHVQRLQIVKSRYFKRKTGGEFTPEEKEIVKRAKDFYENKIKDKPYPHTEEGRKNLYQEFYEISKDITKLTKQSCVNEDAIVEVEWSQFRDDIKKTMDKPLSFADKLVVKHVQEEADPEINNQKIDDISKQINKNRFGHSNSGEITKLQKAYKKFADAFKADADGFIVGTNGISSAKLKLLEELRKSAEEYLKAKDKDKKMPEDREEMGKQRYEGAKAAYHMADKIIKQYEAKLERDVEAKKEAERIKGRKETREIYFDPNTADSILSIKKDKLKAGSEEAYKKQKEAEERQAQAYAKKEPVTDAEKYEKLINSCRTMKDDPVKADEEILNKEIQEKRVTDLSTMLAAMELSESGEPYNTKAIGDKALEIRYLYSLDTLKTSTYTLNGPEVLKNSLSYTFRAADTRMMLEQSLYDVNKGKYKNIAESHTKYKNDIAELLGRKKPQSVSQQTQKIIDALNEINSIDMSDKSLIGINSYRVRKANAKIMNAVQDSFKNNNRMDMNGYGAKLALDSMALLNTYTGCKSVINYQLMIINAKMKDMNGNRININVENFNKNFGTKNSKQLNKQNNVRKTVPAHAAENLQHNGLNV